MTSLRPITRGMPSGFTLLEVLVASAVLAVVLVVLLGTLTTSLSLWRNTEGKMSADREARSAEMLLAQDLAGAILPANPNLWPRVDGEVLKFLTTKPADYQEDPESNSGDVCYVEYRVEDNRLRRAFRASKETFDSIKGGTFPSGNSNDIAAFNILADSRDAVRLTGLASEANTTHFIVLGTNNSGSPGELLPLQGAYSASNPPVAIEINFAVTDDRAISNPELLANPQYVLRNAGFYSFRAGLPKPVAAP
jgi:prepilin-type N-terminal cleavage/methylation domain-containing protein